MIQRVQSIFFLVRKRKRGEAGDFRTVFFFVIVQRLAKAAVSMGNTKRHERQLSHYLLVNLLVCHLQSLAICVDLFEISGAIRTVTLALLFQLQMTDIMGRGNGYMQHRTPY